MLLRLAPPQPPLTPHKPRDSSLDQRAKTAREFLNIVLAVDVGSERNTCGKGKGVLWGRVGGLLRKEKKKKNEERNKNIKGRRSEGP